MMKRNILFIVSILVTLVVFYLPLTELLGLSLHNELYSHIPLIPLVSGFFLYWDRKSIFSHVEYSVGAGVAVIAIGAILATIGFMRVTTLDQNDYLSLMTLSAWLVGMGTFILFYGRQAFKRETFPLLFLLFMIPIPSAVTQAAIQFLQKGSTEAVNVLFYLLGVPATREGFVFHLPGLSIEVLENCSGIRSSIALVITSVIASKLLLRRGWTRSLVAISIVPIAILKNGIRIVTLSILGVYIDERILLGDLHKKGGIVFFCISLVLLWAVIIPLRKLEVSRQSQKQ
jgi:exosortase